MIPAIAPKVKRLVIYGRSPSYVTPMFDSAYSSIWRFLFKNVPYFHKIYCTLWYYFLDLSCVIYNRLSLSSAFHRTVLYIMVWILRVVQIPDQELRAKVVPPHEFGVRRSILSNTFYKCLSNENVEFHREQIANIEGNRITTADGQTRELDVLIVATGFSVNTRFLPGDWVGRNGRDIGRENVGKPSSYFGVCVPKAPNCFMIWGPYSGSYHQSITSVTESQVMFIIKSISMMMEKDFAAIEVKEKLIEDFTRVATQRAELGVKYVKDAASPADAKAGILGPILWYGPLSLFRWDLSRFSVDLFDHSPRSAQEKSKTK